jgi:hypothetical protein
MLGKLEDIEDDIGGKYGEGKSGMSEHEDGSVLYGIGCEYDE